MIKTEIVGWKYYLRKFPLEISHCGKWMYFFNDYAFAENIVKKAVSQKVVDEANVRKVDNGVCCFYIDGTDDNSHKRVIKFLLDNGLIKKTKSGRLYNMSFKFDSQTDEKEYGKNFTPSIKLSDFINLKTGEFKTKKQE